ncbi:uncharacterized protein LOC142573957 isoform X2 [Dermacentor variabilis]|uniref:uncharacterized protein LOC142573957 isoform X2 n=1 Tax=Dermacentor variabilis TaxID=34621 RepID=UPI003F5B6FC1
MASPGCSSSTPPTEESPPRVVSPPDLQPSEEFSNQNLPVQAKKLVPYVYAQTDILPSRDLGQRLLHKGGSRGGHHTGRCFSARFGNKRASRTMQQRRQADSVARR